MSGWLEATVAVGLVGAMAVVIAYGLLRLVRARW